METQDDGQLADDDVDDDRRAGWMIQAALLRDMSPHRSCVRGALGL